jgi:hypothetical protein
MSLVTTFDLRFFFVSQFPNGHLINCRNFDFSLEFAKIWALGNLGSLTVVILQYKSIFCLDAIGWFVVCPFSNLFLR